MSKLNTLFFLVLVLFAGVVSASVVVDLPSKEQVVLCFDRGHEQQQAY